MSQAPTPLDLLILALKKAGIQHASHRILSLSMTRYYWQETKDGGIEIVFDTDYLSAGRLSCSMRIEKLARRICRILPEADVLNALTDTLEFLKLNVILLLPITDNNILTRAYNLATKSSPHSHKSDDSVAALFDTMIEAYRDSRAGVEKRLRAEPITRRGGSNPRLPTNQRESLHAQYEIQYIRAKKIKKDYNTKLKAFQKSRGVRGFTRQNLRDYWMKDSNDFPLEIRQYLEMFAEVDNPSASEIAYRVLAAQTGHKKSYLERLVADSRKAAKKRDNESND
jgi:hypothetical protein